MSFTFTSKEASPTAEKCEKGPVVQYLESTNPVLKVRELSSSSAASKPAPESAAAAPSGGHERAPANRSPATATEAHAATSAPETPASTIVTQRNPERLGVHPPLLRPGLPPFPERKNTSESKSTACHSVTTVAVQDSIPKIHLWQYTRLIWNMFMWH